VPKQATGSGIKLSCLPRRWVLWSAVATNDMLCSVQLLDWSCFPCLQMADVLLFTSKAVCRLPLMLAGSWWPDASLHSAFRLILGMFAMVLLHQQREVMMRPGSAPLAQNGATDSRRHHSVQYSPGCQCTLQQPSWCRCI
jgi:hypothetical protein